MLRYPALLLIRAYQRYISPHKGFHCAYRRHRRCASCSQLGYLAIRRYGLLKGILLLRMRLERCKAIIHREGILPRIDHGATNAGIVTPVVMQTSSIAVAAAIGPAAPNEIPNRASSEFRPEAEVRFLFF